MQEIGLVRTVVAVVPSFAAALSVARSSELVVLVPLSFVKGLRGSQNEDLMSVVHTFPLPVRTEPITVSQMWHPRMDADPAHRWLRGMMLTACRANSVKARNRKPRFGGSGAFIRNAQTAAGMIGGDRGQPSCM